MKLNNFLLTKTIYCIIFLLGLSNFSMAQEERYRDGLKLLIGYEQLRAAEVFKDVLKQYPNHAPSLYQLAKINSNFGKLEIAKEQYSKVIELNQEFTSEAFFELEGLHLKTGDTLNALKQLNSALDANPDFDAAYNERAKINLENKDFEKGFIDAQHAVELNDTSADYYLTRAIAYVELEEYDSALVDLDSAISLNDELENAYFYRGYCYYTKSLDPEASHKRDLLHKALDDYNKCIELEPEDELAYFDRGETHMAIAQLRASNKHHYVDAIKDFNSALDINPLNKEALYNKAICNYRYGFHDDALEDFERILEIDSTYADALYQVGVLKYDQSSYKESLEYFDRLIEVEEDHADALLYRGYVYLEMDKTSEACSDWETADTLGDVDKELHKELQRDIKKYCTKKKKK